jgi:hypothetical protein
MSCRVNGKLAAIFQIIGFFGRHWLWFLLPPRLPNKWGTPTPLVLNIFPGIVRTYNMYIAISNSSSLQSLARGIIAILFSRRR